MTTMWASEQLVLCRDEEVGLSAVIAIDDTTLGPGLGGIRFKPYPSAAAAVTEARRLAAAMTRKNALADIPYGGAKSVIVDDGAMRDRSALMVRFGEFVARTGGAYLPGVDMGTTVADLAIMRRAGAVVSCDEEDPSPWTALGVAAAIRAAVGDVDGISVLIQGAGHVGAALAADLASDGARILVVDVDQARASAVAEAVGGETVELDAALTTECDVFAPCAVARVATPDTIPALRCRFLAGAANDTLATRECADLLAARGIAYVPDYVANAGGVLQIHARRSGHDDARLKRDVLRIGDRVSEILEEAARRRITPLAVAEQRAERVLTTARAAHHVARAAA